MTPEFRAYAEAELALCRERYQTRAARFRAAALQSSQEWRLQHITPRPDDDAALILRAGLASIIELRLRVAYLPLFQSLERIKRRVGVLADLRRERWAHPQHESNRRG